MSKTVPGVLVFFLIFAFSRPVLAASVPNTLNYQGTLIDNTGKAVTESAKPITFRLYTSALGGTAFWTEPQVVQVTNGQFSVVLGSTVTLPVDQFTGETYVGVTVNNGPEMLPRQKLTSVAYALKAPDTIPKGVIVMWSGEVYQVPEGWALCNGLNGTPDLTDKFIVGAGRNYAGQAQGGTASIDVSHHTHSMQNHIHSVAIGAVGSDGSNNGYVTVDFKRSGTNETLGPVGQHYHSTYVGGSISPANGLTVSNTGEATASSGFSTNFDNRPPYFALAFIMKK